MAGLSHPVCVVLAGDKKPPGFSRGAFFWQKGIRPTQRMNHQTSKQALLHFHYEKTYDGLIQRTSKMPFFVVSMKSSALISVSL